MSETTEVSVRRSLTVPIAPAKAFELFTARMTEFWPKEHSIGSSALAAVVVEPRSGGRWFERGVDGSECQWGRVVEWAPPSRLVLAWQITVEWKFDPGFETLVEVEFLDASSGTTVALAHRHLERYGDQAQTMYDVFNSPGGWDSTLSAFDAVAR